MANTLKFILQWGRNAPKMSRLLVPDEHRDDGKRFVVRADEKLTAFLELEAAIL